MKNKKNRPLIGQYKKRLLKQATTAEQAAFLEVKNKTDSVCFRKTVNAYFRHISKTANAAQVRCSRFIKSVAQAENANELNRKMREMCVFFDKTLNF